MQPSSLGTFFDGAGESQKRSRVRGVKIPAELRSVRKIRFTAAEWQLVEERARACGCAPARYVRDAALGTVPKVSRTRGNASAIRELGAIAGALQELNRGDPRAADGTESGIHRAVDALITRVLGVATRLA
jgi:hypothetical protein